MYRLKLPNMIDFDAERVDESEDIWEFEYRECFGPEDKEVIYNAINEIPTEELSYDIQVEENCLVMKGKEKRKILFGNLVGEFIMNSNVGDLRLKDMVLSTIEGSFDRIRRQSVEAIEVAEGESIEGGEESEDRD